MKLLLGTGDFRKYGLPSSWLLNRYYEQAPTTSEQVALIPRPGLILFGEVEASSVIAIFFQPGTLDNLIMVVTSNFIYALNASGAVVGTTPVLDLEPRVSMASGLDGVLYLTDGAQLLRCTVTAGSTTITVTAVPFPDSAACSSVCYLNSYFLFTRADSQKVYFLRPGQTAIDPLDFFSAETAPDDLVAAFVLADELWLMGKSTVEVHSPTGDADLPFQRQVGRPTDFSLANRDTVQKLDNSLFFVGSDRIVYRAAGLPEAISDSGVDDVLAGAPLADLRAFQFGVGKHLFYCLNVPNRGTLAYDASTGRWTRLASLDEATFNCLTSCRLADGTWLAGDSTDGLVYSFSGVDENGVPEVNDDNGVPIVRIAPAIIEAPLTRCSNVVLDCSVGEGFDPSLDPKMSMRESDDLKTWSDWEDADLGRTGEYDADCVWWQRGMISRRRLFEFRDSNAVATIIRGASINEGIR